MWNQKWNFLQTISLFYKLLGIIRSGEVEKVGDSIESLKIQMNWLEKELSERGTTYFGGDFLNPLNKKLYFNSLCIIFSIGDEPGMVDYMIWPWMERMPLIKLNMPDAIDYEKAKAEIPKVVS